ncbi:MAG: hypothetical protein DRP85_07560 [Candidatus Makaraimicrobium thalassicum]|nr:MAG: hypothetical protein DRP85_07560 [Candidatus Omnitrophota bacterium]
MKKIKLIPVILLSIMLVFPPNALAGPVGAITFIEGRVDRLAQGGDAYIPVRAGEEISTGDVIRTKSYSKAEITFSDDSVVRMGDTSLIRVRDYAVGEDGYRRAGVIDVDRGKIRAIVSRTADKVPFKINTPNASGNVKGSDVFVSYQQSTTNVLVAGGLLTMENPSFPGECIDVRDGMTALVPYNAPPEEPRVFLPEEKDRIEAVTGPATYKAEGIAAGAEFTGAVVTRVTGAVRVQPRGSKKWHAPVKNEALGTGGRIETGKSGRIQINFDNGIVIELKPETQLIITRLTRDPRTGDYTNEFEAGYGKIIAKLQKVPPKSSFMIRTPHAVCGVRGTIMYLDILTNMTKAFFEGGDGYVTDMINGVTKVIQNGMSSSVDADGNISDPTETTGEERSQFNSEFGSEGQDEYGYTDPDTDTGGGASSVSDPDPSPPSDPLPGGSGPGDDDTAPFDEVIPETGTTGGWTYSTTCSDLEGRFGNYGSWKEEGYDPFTAERDENNHLTGVLTADRSEAPWNGSFQAKVSGSSNNTGEEDAAFFAGRITGSGEDDGSIYGLMAGSGHGESGWDAVLAALYVDSSGTSGTMLAPDMTGTHDEGEIGDFTGSGSITYVPEGVTGVLPGELGDHTVAGTPMEGSVSVSVAGGAGYLNTDFMMTLLNIEDEPWGIWGSMYSAGYDRPEGLSSWAGVLGGSTGDGGYIFGVAEGTDDQDNGFLRLDVVTTWLDLFSLGVSLGSIVGEYEQADSYYFEGVGAGLWAYKPLSYVSEIEESLFLSCYYDRGGYNYTTGGYISALMGGVGSLWAGSADVTLMGDCAVLDEELSHLWYAPVFSVDYNNETYTTYDGGAYYGYVLGSKIGPENWMEGLMVALYVGPGGAGGYISGSFSGGIYPELGETGMFSMTGSLDITEMAPGGVGLLPGALYGYFEEFFGGGALDGRGLGCFGEDGVISGKMAGESLEFDLDEFDITSWGIWRATIIGTFEGSEEPSDSWSIPLFGEVLNGRLAPGNPMEYELDPEDSHPEIPDAYYLGVVQGTQWQQDGRIAGGFEGIWLDENDDGLGWGTISGEVIGNNEYIEAGEEFVGSWQAVAAGEWVEVGELIFPDMEDLAGLASQIEEMAGFDVVSIPITDLAGMGTGILDAAMNLTLFRDVSAMEGIWAGLVNGHYASDVISPEWDMSFATGEGTSIDFQGLEWANGEWLAKVDGSVKGNLLTGTAEGTYNETAETFSGAAAGTWMSEEIAGSHGGR